MRLLARQEQTMASKRGEHARVHTHIDWPRQRPPRIGSAADDSFVSWLSYDVCDVMCDVCDLERKVLLGCTLAVHAVHAKIKNFVEAVELMMISKRLKYMLPPLVCL